MLVGGAADAGQFGQNEAAVVEQVGVNVAAMPVA